jgi:hypothetical protein
MSSRCPWTECDEWRLRGNGSHICWPRSCRARIGFLILICGISFCIYGTRQGFRMKFSSPSLFWSTVVQCKREWDPIFISLVLTSCCPSQTSCCPFLSSTLTWGIASLRQTTDFSAGYIADWSYREELLGLAGMMPSPTQLRKLCRQRQCVILRSEVGSHQPCMRAPIVPDK